MQLNNGTVQSLTALCDSRMCSDVRALLLKLTHAQQHDAMPTSVSLSTSLLLDLSSCTKMVQNVLAAMKSVVAISSANPMSAEHLCKHRLQ